MEALSSFISGINGYVWGWPMLVAILGTGFYLMVRIKAMPLLNIGSAFKLLAQGREGQGKGHISPFQALMTSLSATIGTGNIAGVATAIAIGGPGALFWMWCTALVGMATKYSEAVLAVNFREKDAEGNYSGGPMYYIRNGLGQKWQWLAIAFALFGTIAGFGIGNMVQANSVADALHSNFDIPAQVTAGVLFVCVSLVVIGGVKRIGLVAATLVPVMAVSYLTLGIAVLALNVTELPGVFSLVVSDAFTGTAASGGFAGATVWAAIRMGVARGVFSNEAGLGSAPIAHAAAQTNSPVQQGKIAMLGTFIDTILVCSVTGFAIILSGLWDSGQTGAALSTAAFQSQIPGGQYIVSIGLAIFAFTTILGWSYYGERCAVYLFGAKAAMPFRVFWVCAVPLGAVAKLAFVWLLADTLNAMMALPNLIALVLLAPVVVKLTKEYKAANA